MLFDNNLLNTGLILSAAGGTVYWLKSVPLTIINKLKRKFIFTVRIYDYDEFFSVFEEWLFKNYNSKYMDVEVGYNILNTNPYHYSENPEKEEEGKKINYKQGPNLFILKLKGKKFLVKKTKEKVEHATDRRSLFCSHYMISGFSAKKQLSELLEEISLDYLNSKQDNKISIFSFNGIWGLASKRKVKPLEGVILRDSIKKNLQKDLETFQTSQEWYYQNSLLYKRSYLFYGPPGTGKTTLSLAIASQTKRNVYILNLGSLYSDATLIEAFGSIPKNSVLLIEDIDAAFNKRENVENCKVSFSCLLNCLDGSLSREGLITIITTNHIEKLDPALLRAGRIDLKVHVDYPSNKEIEEYLFRFYGRRFFLEEEINIPMSQVQEICMANRYNPENATQILKNKQEIYAGTEN